MAALTELLKSLLVCAFISAFFLLGVIAEFKHWSYLGFILAGVFMGATSSVFAAILFPAEKK
jgi:hypothetical protein